MLNVCCVTLVQLHLDDRAEDAEQVLRQVLALRHALLLHHHILRGLPQELEEGGLRGNELEHLEDVDEVQVTLEVLEDVLILLVQISNGLRIALSELLRSRSQLLRESLRLLLDLWSEESASVLNSRFYVHALVSRGSHWLLIWLAALNHELCLLLKSFVLILVLL